MSVRVATACVMYANIGTFPPTQKREFDEQVKQDRFEQLHEVAYHYRYNRLRKLKRGKAANPQKTAAVDNAFQMFRKEGVKRKGMVKRGEMKLPDPV